MSAHLGCCYNKVDNKYLHDQLFNKLGLNVEIGKVRKDLIKELPKLTKFKSILKSDIISKYHN